MPRINPEDAPSPRSILGYDGDEYQVPRTRTGRRLLVSGEDQLHSFAGVLCTYRSAAISGADGYVESNAVPAGSIWHVTHICVADVTTATTEIYVRVNHDGGVRPLNHQVAALAANDWWGFPCEIWMDENDLVRAIFIGGLVGDNCEVTLYGESMTVEV